jgi:transcription initiation factor TFIIIB Brf1 subunit/transcription initiation factor TFIIB
MTVSGNQLACKECGMVSDLPIVDKRERRFFDADQRKRLKSRAPVSNRVHDKNLGSFILTNPAKNNYNYNVFRLKNASVRLAMTVEERELKEVIRLIKLFTDSSKLPLRPVDVERIVVSYKNRFCCTGLAMGRPREAVIAAFLFLEIRLVERYMHLSHERYVEMISLQPELVDDFMSAMKIMIKEKGYKLTQPPVEIHVKNVMMEEDMKPALITMAVNIARRMKSFYRYAGRKNSGIVAAIIYIVFRDNGQKINGRQISKDYVTKLVHGVHAVTTVRARIKEIRSIIGYLPSKNPVTMSTTRGKAGDGRCLKAGDRREVTKNTSTGHRFKKA